MRRGHWWWGVALGLPVSVWAQSQVSPQDLDAAQRTAGQIQQILAARPVEMPPARPPQEVPPSDPTLAGICMATSPSACPQWLPGAALEGADPAQKANRLAFCDLESSSFKECLAANASAPAAVPPPAPLAYHVYQFIQKHPDGTQDVTVVLAAPSQDILAHVGQMVVRIKVSPSEETTTPGVMTWVEVGGLRQADTYAVGATRIIALGTAQSISIQRLS